MNSTIIINILGVLLILTGILDALKYSWQSSKIRYLKSAQGQSRNFINAALTNNVVRIIYLCFHWDLYLMISSLIAMWCILDMWYQIYLFYPYRKRGLKNFKRPTIFTYIVNSLLPNALRKRL